MDLASINNLWLNTKHFINEGDLEGAIFRGGIYIQIWVSLGSRHRGRGVNRGRSASQ